MVAKEWERVYREVHCVLFFLLPAGYLMGFMFKETYMYEKMFPIHNYTLLLNGLS